MKKGLLFSLALLFLLAGFTGCGNNRANVAVPHRAAPHRGVVRSSRRPAPATRNGFHHRYGDVSNALNRAEHDGRITDDDGIIGNGYDADKPAHHRGHHGRHRPAEGRIARDVRTGINRMESGLARGITAVERTTDRATTTNVPSTIQRGDGWYSGATTRQLAQ